MPTITVNGQTGTVNVQPNTQLQIAFSGFGGWYGGATKYLYDINRATPLLLWSGDANTLTLSSGNANVTMILRAFDYCIGDSLSSCYYPSNDVTVSVGAGSATTAIDCPQGDRYLRGLFQNCEVGYTLGSGLLQNECVCNKAIEQGRETTESKTNWGNIALTLGFAAVGIYVLTQVLGGKK